MNFKKLLFSLMIIAAMAVSGCGSKPEKEISSDADLITSDATVAEQETDKADNNAFVKKYINTGVRPIAVMIDNDDNNARPQAGLEDAYLIYELLVEGGSTRFMALFQGVNTEKIGPVRSSRHYFIDYAMENDAIYTHFGWSPRAMQDISAYSVDKINGVLGEDGNVFWRERKFAGDWHSAYTSIDLIKKQAEKKEYETETEHEIGLKFSEEDYTPETQMSASKVSLKYSQKYSTSYAYDAQTGLYEKSIGSEPHVMQSGETLKFKNIIVELIQDTALGDGSDRRDIKTTGQGKGYYITNGFCEEITWSKDIRESNTTYKKADGTELFINQGQTIINVISPESGVILN